MRRGVAAVVVGVLASLPFMSTAQAAAGVTLLDNTYSPDSVTVRAGDEVVWTDAGNNPHSVTADDNSFSSSSSASCHTGLISQTSGCMHRGQTFRHTFANSGTYSYRCLIHGNSGMVGVVTVLDASQTPPSTRRTTTTRAGATTTKPGETTTTETLLPGGAVGVDSSGTDATGSAAAKSSGGSDNGSRAVLAIVAALAAVAIGGGALLWRLRPRLG